MIHMQNEPLENKLPETESAATVVSEAEALAAEEMEAGATAAAEEAPLCPIKSKIGGQALIEGVMMKGLGRCAMAVRLPDGSIDVEEWSQKPGKFMSVVSKIPVVRGVFNFVSSMISGYQCLSKSAEKAGLEEEEGEPGRFEQWLDRTFGENLMKAITVVGAVLGVALALLLFMVLPSMAVKGLDMLVPLGGWKALLEGVIKMLIFVGYLALVSRMKEIHRVFEYHGAEHKTIFCYEKGLPLTVENVRTQRRFHPRCGTSFMILILIISILLYSVVSWDSLLIRVALKLAMLPLVMGIGYELLKLCGRYDNWLTRGIAWPGIQLQRLTTCEPDDSQIEVAIASLKPVLPQNREEDRW